MTTQNFDPLVSCLSDIASFRRMGRVSGTSDGGVEVTGLSRVASIGAQVEIRQKNQQRSFGEIVRLASGHIHVLVEDSIGGVSLGDPVFLCRDRKFRPGNDWIGRVVDSNGNPLDGRLLPNGPVAVSLMQSAPPAVARRGLGARLRSGLKIFNTVLPLVRGQRIGLFAGSGVGKSTLLGQLVQTLDADVCVIGLVGERGREVREFVEKTLGPEGMARSVVVAETSDKSSLLKRRAAWAAMAVAEHFRDQGKQVLLVIDSLTRFAEAHREIALAGGESASMRSFPPSTSAQIMSLCERAGPGIDGRGDITAIFSVLVAGSDMEEPIADIVRGVLDGHVVLDRRIAERGRFPAIDVLKSVSRSLPAAARVDENATIAATRRALGLYEASELMIRAGLYEAGSDPELDRAISIWPEIDAFIATAEDGEIADSFVSLNACLDEVAKPAERAQE